MSDQKIARPKNRNQYSDISIEDRFWSKVNKSDGCWNWTAQKFKRGYGHFRSNGKMVGAHRFSWEMANGAIPTGLHVLHRCDNSGCVNPAHLFLGTNDDNSRDCTKKGRQPAGGRNGRAKLTEKQVRLIRELKSGGMGTMEIAKRFGVVRSTVLYIHNRTHWTRI